MQDVHAAFISEFPNVVTLPAGWEWHRLYTGLSFLSGGHTTYNLVIRIDAWDDGPSIRLWMGNSEAVEHHRDYEWADPALLTKMEQWIRWLSETWVLVAELSH